MTDLWTLPINPGKGQADIRQPKTSIKQISVSTQVREHHHSPLMALFAECRPYHKGVTYQIPTAKGMNTPFVGPCIGSTPHPVVVNVASFMRSVNTWFNTVKFAHQLLCSPYILTLLKATHKGFIKWVFKDQWEVDPESNSTQVQQQQKGTQSGSDTEYAAPNQRGYRNQLYTATAKMNRLPIYSTLVHLPVRVQALCIMTWPKISCLCHWMVAYVIWSCIIMKQILSLQHQSYD